MEHTLRVLAELKNATNGELSVRLISHPIAMGVIATDSGPQCRSLVTAAFIEYYSYQIPGEPKFVLRPDGNRLGYDLFIEEAEALWKNATAYDLVAHHGLGQP